MRSATDFGSMFTVSGSTSANTGMQLDQMIGMTAPGSVMGAEMISEPMSRRRAPKAVWMEAVPLLVAVPKRVPTWAANSCS
jgi:hypothetical protein